MLILRSLDHTSRSKKSEDKFREMVKKTQMVKEKLKREPRTAVELLHREEQKRGNRKKKLKLHVCFNFRKTC